MKKLSFTILFLALFSCVFAQSTWTVNTVPNTRLQGNSIHVSDPDGYLSDSAEMTINTALCAIRDTVDVFLVTLSSIGDAAPKSFATKLFNHWGIGDAGKDNGVLLLFVEDQHALEFETGYGAEATLTDAMCQRIFSKTIVPYFRRGDYEGGLCAGVADIVSVYGGEVPVGLMTFQPAKNHEENTGGGSDFDDVSMFSIMVLLMMGVMPVVGLVYWVKKRNDKTMMPESLKTQTEDGITYLEGAKTSWSGSPWEGKGCLGALLIGFSLFVFYAITITLVAKWFPDLSEKRQLIWASLTALLLYFTWMCFRQGRRTLQTADELAKNSVNPKEVYKAASNHTANKVAFWMAPWLGWYFVNRLKTRIAQSEECQCPTCHARMRKDAGFHLPERHALENRLGAMEYKPYRCPNGHSFVLKDRGKQYSNYSTCEVCGAHTMKMTHSVTLKAANYSHSGEKEETYECRNCGHSKKKKVVIPMKIRTYSSGSYSSGSSSRSYSSRSSGGSFGGGRSGGGGFSGRW